MSSDQSLHLYALPEYHSALGNLINGAINQLMRQKDPVLAMIRTERSSHVRATQNTMDSGVVVDGPTMQLAMRFEFRFEDVVSGNVAGFVKAIDEAADDGVRQLMPQIFDRITKISDGAGTRVNAGGQPISWDLILDAWETMEFDFDSDGQPVLPTMVGHPSMADKFRSLPPPNEIQSRRAEKLFERKRKEHDARQRRRILS